MKRLPFTALALLALSLLMPVSSQLRAEESGEVLFQKNCMACHQRDGQGIEGVFPALAGNELVRGSGLDIVALLMVGRGDMPAFRDALSYSELTNLVNYVRNAWGNNGELLDAQEIRRFIEH